MYFLRIFEIIEIFRTLGIFLTFSGFWDILEPFGILLDLTNLGISGSGPPIKAFLGFFVHQDDWLIM